MPKNAVHFAIFSILLADISIVLMGAFAKDLAPHYSPLEITFLRNITALIAVTAWIMLSKQFHLFKTTRLKGQIWRAVIGTMDVVLVFWAYALIPLAMVTTILFIVPILTLALSIIFLKEKAGIYRWGAVVAGFVAMIVLSWPAISNSAHDNISLLGVGVAIIASIGAAFVQIMLRSLGKAGEPAMTTIFYFLLIGSLILAVPVLTQGIHLYTALAASIAGLCVTGLGNQVFKTIAYQKGEASLLAPFRYLSLIWAALLGYVVWKEIPTVETLIAAVIIIAANLLIVLRERHAKKQ